MRVLVVEDDVRMADMLRRGLADDGYAVDVAVDGVDGLWHATELDYDAVVLDVMLPRMDGFAVLHALRKAERWAPVLLLTARSGDEDLVRGLDGGADDYLTKPFTFTELSARLRALVRRGAVERPAVLDVGGLRLDPASRKVWRDGTEVELSSKETSLLELFLRNPGTVLSRAVITDHVWDFASAGLSNVVDQYVSYLRRKVDRPFGVEQLDTVRGSGYCLRPVPRATD